MHNRKIAIIGSRNYKDTTRILTLIEFLDHNGSDPRPMLISGGAKGPDSIAQKEAEKRGWIIRIFQADWDNLGRGAGFARNTDIAREADVVYAFWDGKSKGTLDTITKAVIMGKDVNILADSVK